MLILLFDEFVLNDTVPPLRWAGVAFIGADLPRLADPAHVRAVVLVGGEGTRLRPITETIPKPLVPLVDRLSLAHVLDHLERHGVHEVLSSSYHEETFGAFIRSRHGDPAITWITEIDRSAPAG